MSEEGVEGGGGSPSLPPPDDTNPFAHLLLGVETDAVLLEELGELEGAVEADAHVRAEAAERLVTQLKDEIVRKDEQVHKYVALRRKVDARRAAELAAVKRELEACRQEAARGGGDPPEASPPPTDLAARLARLPGGGGGGGGSRPDGVTDAAAEEGKAVEDPRLEAWKQQIMRGEGVIGNSIQWAASQRDPALGASAKGILTPILSWYLDLRQAIGE